MKNKIRCSVSPIYTQNGILYKIDGCNYEVVSNLKRAEPNAMEKIKIAQQAVCMTSEYKDFCSKNISEHCIIGQAVDVFGIPLSDSFGWYVEKCSEYDARKIANILAVAYVHVCEAMEDKRKEGEV